MKTGTKIAFFYSGITIGMITVVAVIFYWVTITFINRLYYSYLMEKAYVVAEKHWEKDEVNAADYELIQKRYEEALPVASEIMLNADSITETNAALSRYMTEAEIEMLYAGNVIRFHHGEQLGTAIYYPDNEGNFIVVVLSGNQYGRDIQQHIGWLLLGMLLTSTILIYFVGRFYATRMVDKIDAAYKSEKSFVANASHELNNPLTAIQGECEISLLKERTPAEYQAALERIQTEAKRIIQLMKQLLFLSKNDSEFLNNATERIMLSEFVKQLPADELFVSPENAVAVIYAEPYLLKTALDNLLNNARKYSGGNPVRMSLNGWVLDIEDKGIGIPEEELKRIRQPFYRASNVRGYKGNGIGLSLSLRILQLYGASVAITSELNRGTTVRIRFRPGIPQERIKTDV